MARAQRRRGATWIGAAALAVTVAACAGEKVRAPEVEAVRPPPFQVEYDGAAQFEGDFEKLGERRAVATKLRALASGGDRLLLEQSTWIDGGGAPPRVETTLVRGERVWRRTVEAGGDSGFVELSGNAAADARRFAELPWRARAPLAGGTGESDFQSEQWRAHPRLGDVLEKSRCARVKLVDGRPVASAISFERFGDFDAQSVELALAKAGAAPESARELELPAGARASSATGPAHAPPAALAPLAAGVFVVEDPACPVRSLAVEFADQFLVLEAPGSSATGERIVDALSAAHPGKPIRAILFSHHHPRFCGGLRPFIAEGAAILTTPLDASFVEAAVMRPFTLAPDRLARRGGKLRIETFDQGRFFADAGQELLVLDLGAASRHCDDYVVFWLPRARILFVGDLAWSGFEGGAPRVGPSGRALADFVAERKLDVATLVQALRVVGGPAEMPWADWLRAVPPAAPAAPTVPADRPAQNL